MGFLQSLQATLDEEYNFSVTENGAIGYRSTGSALLDLNFAVTSLRAASSEQIVTQFTKAYFEDRLLALKWLFFAGDVREGLGERRLFRICLQYLADNHPDHAKQLLPLVAEYTRWDNLLCLLDGGLQEDVLALLARQLEADLRHMRQGENISLLAKWLPSINVSSARTHHYAKIILTHLHYTNAQYRKTLADLRRYANVVEVQMSSRQWGEIRYEAVPARANLLYNSAFLRNDNARRRDYLARLSRGETTIHADVLFPHDIVAQYIDFPLGLPQLAPHNDALELLWKALPDYVQGNATTLCVSDGSGSMCRQVQGSSATCLDVANALTIYFAERCSGEFRNKYITFSSRPQMVDLSHGTSLRDKLEIALSHNEVTNTNLEAVFDLILDTAVKCNMPQSELPQNLLILSDMEFDNAMGYHYYRTVPETLFDTIGRKFAAHGYRLPRLIFWNIQSPSGAIPVKQNDLGVALVSGFSPVIVKMVLSNEVDPYRALLEAINAPRYEAVEQAILA